MKTQTIYLIPPVLSLLFSLILSGIAIRTKPRTTELKLFSVVFSGPANGLPLLSTIC